MFANKFRMFNVERTRVRLLLGDTDLRQILDQHLRLDLELPGQLVDADLNRFGHCLAVVFCFLFGWLFRGLLGLAMRLFHRFHCGRASCAFGGSFYI
jgi:hypothetical protein